MVADRNYRINGKLGKSASFSHEIKAQSAPEAATKAVENFLNNYDTVHLIGTWTVIVTRIDESLPKTRKAWRGAFKVRAYTEIKCKIEV